MNIPGHIAAKIESFSTITTEEKGQPYVRSGGGGGVAVVKLLCVMGSHKRLTATTLRHPSAKKTILGCLNGRKICPPK